MTENIWSGDEIVNDFYSKKDKEESGKPVLYHFLYQGEHCTLNAVQITAESGVPLHIHQYHDEIIQMMEGEGESMIGDLKRSLKKGDIFFAPKGIPHALPFPCIILSIYAPAFDSQNPDRVFL